MIIVNTTPQASKPSTIPSNTPTRLPSNRKRLRTDYKSLHSFGFQGALPKSPQQGPTKKARIEGSRKKQAKESQDTVIIENTIQSNQEEEEPKKNGAGKRA